MRALILTLLVVGLALADVYMHNPRGSNDRCCERGDRQNANRLFNSQNNAAGGYACPYGRNPTTGEAIPAPMMYYYSGSKLRVEWTSQHSCGFGNTNCQVVIQYACRDTLPGMKDGFPTANDQTCTTTPTLTNYNNTNVGYHEPPEYFDRCNRRNRNKGLYTADRNVNNNAQSTIQNNGGGPSGFECQEERDYYPYWLPSPWKDIVVFTSNTSMCDWYKRESQNVKNKGECWTKDGTAYRNEAIREECLSAGGSWKETGAYNIPPPECLSTDLINTRDNHLGNSLDGETAHYWWTLPDVKEETECVLRLRYNMSSMDFHPFATDSLSNAANAPVKNDQRQDWGHGGWLHLAINTNQLPRTFQDRSYIFKVKPRPAEIGNAPIWNLNVRGKRGNIVQTYPAVEYDFVPTHLTVRGGDYVHFQWTGSDFNPPGNDGEGAPAGSDRNNLVEIEYQGTNLPKRADLTRMFLTANGQVDFELLYKLAFIGQQNTTDKPCLAYDKRNNQNSDQDLTNCGKLNQIQHPYFDAGLVQMRTSGTFNYICTRNNNFSNRSQKGRITVIGGWFAGASTVSVSAVTLLISLAVALFMLL